MAQQRDDGVTVVSNSLIKGFRQCARATLYKQIDELAPKSVSKPLTRGKWFHALMEVYYKSGDWKEEHAKWVSSYSKLFDEEKEKLGDLPTELAGMMRSYLWHYKKDDDWEIIAVEGQFEFKWTDDITYKFRFDLLVRDGYGLLWMVDHKTHKRLPNHDMRLLDTQSVLYVDAVNQSPEIREALGIGDELVQGFIWNYIKTEGPTRVRINKNGSIAKNQAVTDYPTAYASIKNQGKDPKDYKDFLRACASQRYEPDAVQTSPFFQRTTIERDPGMIDRVRREALRTARRYRKYRFDIRDAVERTVDRSCDWCAYTKLCTTELLGGNTDQVLRMNYQNQDPFSYYDETEGMMV